MGVPTTQSEEDGDAALEAYMSNLMNRVSGDPATIIQKPLRKSLPVVVPQEQAVTSEVVTAEAVRPIDMEEIKRTSMKPALSVDITAIRELANQSADQAIASHQQRNHANANLSKLVYGGIAMIVALLLILNAEHYRDLSFLGGCLAAMVGFYGTIPLFVTLLQAIRAGSQVEERMDKHIEHKEHEELG
jgi:hypothetical protein